MNKGEARHEFSNIETFGAIIDWEMKRLFDFVKENKFKPYVKDAMLDYMNEVYAKFHKKNERCKKLFDQMLVNLPDGEYKGDNEWEEL